MKKILNYEGKYVNSNSLIMFNHYRTFILPKMLTNESKDYQPYQPQGLH
jgi:hypothetical protein